MTSLRSDIIGDVCYTLPQMKENPLKGKIGLLTLQYSRCKVYNSSWFDFREGIHGIDSIVEWANQLREQGIVRSRWGA